MTYRDYDRGRGRRMDWGGPGNGYRGQFSRQDQFGGQGGYGGYGSFEGQGEYGGQGYSNQGQFSEPYGGQYGQGYGQDFGRQGIGWQQRQFGGEPFAQDVGWERGPVSGRGFRDEGQFGGWRDQEVGGYGPSPRIAERYGPYGAGNAAGGWQPNAEQGWGSQGRTPAGSWDQPEGWEQGPSGRGHWGQGYSGQGPWGQGRPRQEFGGQWRPGGTLFYEEAWLMPGPFAGRGPRGYQRSDQRIEEDVCERLTQHGQVDASDIQVQVRNGEVTLTGVVEDRQTKRMTEDVLDAIPGVKDVHNQLRVQQGQGQIGQETGRASTGQGRGTSRGQAQRNETVKAGASGS